MVRNVREDRRIVFQKRWESLQSSHVSAAFCAKFKGKGRELHNITELIIQFNHCGSSQGASSLNLNESTKGASTYDCKAIHYVQPSRQRFEHTLHPM